ncbi:MAG: universal stress protein [Oscillochloridaceae bacterium umkhey_bin13]
MQSLIKHIMLGVDGSAPSKRAAEYAVCLALIQNSRVTVVHAYTVASTLKANASDLPTNASPYEVAHSLIFDTVDFLRNEGIENVEQIVEEGPAVNVLIDAIESCAPDMIIVGARGTSEWNGTIQGSVSAAVTQRAPCPVLVVK